MAAAPLPLLVIVVRSACARPGASPDQSALLAVNQCSGASSDRSADANPLGGLSFSSLRIMASSLRRCTADGKTYEKHANGQCQ